MSKVEIRAKIKNQRFGIDKTISIKSNIDTYKDGEVYDNLSHGVIMNSARVTVDEWLLENMEIEILKITKVEEGDGNCNCGHPACKECMRSIDEPMQDKKYLQDEDDLER